MLRAYYNVAGLGSERAKLKHADTRTYMHMPLAHVYIRIA